MKDSEAKILTLFVLIVFGYYLVMKPYKEQEPAVNDIEPDQQGVLFEQPEVDSIETPKAEFKSYSPLVDQQKNHVKFKR